MSHSHAQPRVSALEWMRSLRDGPIVVIRGDTAGTGTGRIDLGPEVRCRYSTTVLYAVEQKNCYDDGVSGALIGLDGTQTSTAIATFAKCCCHGVC